jgi:hypothetical protein
MSCIHQVLLVSLVGFEGMLVCLDGSRTLDTTEYDIIIRNCSWRLLLFRLLILLLSYLVLALLLHALTTLPPSPVPVLHIDSAIALFEVLLFPGQIGLRVFTSYIVSRQRTAPLKIDGRYVSARRTWALLFVRHHTCRFMACPQGFERFRDGMLESLVFFRMIPQRLVRLSIMRKNGI